MSSRLMAKSDESLLSVGLLLYYGHVASNNNEFMADSGLESHHANTSILRCLGQIGVECHTPESSDNQVSSQLICLINLHRSPRQVSAYREE